MPAMIRSLGYRSPRCISRCPDQVTSLKRDPQCAVPTVKKRRRNIKLSFSHDSVTTERLKTYSVQRAIGPQRARDQTGRDRQGGIRTGDQRRNGIRRQETRGI
ncbi:hypothetical protein TNCV_3254141 [Trichonephila clavipes]|nr:hypothetical protein TNCV_3254141 [Trichonephila clavipes]